jgi:hypothetical protein
VLFSAKKQKVNVSKKEEAPGEKENTKEHLSPSRRFFPHQRLDVYFEGFVRMKGTLRVQVDLNRF